VEKQLKDLTVEQRYLLRQEKNKPLMEDLKQWCDDSVANTTLLCIVGKGWFLMVVIQPKEQRRVRLYTTGGALKIGKIMPDRVIYAGFERFSARRL